MMTSKEFAKLTRAEQVARFEAYKKDDFDEMLNFIDEMISHVDFISLNCTPDDRAVKTLKDYLNGGEAFEQSAK